MTTESASGSTTEQFRLLYYQTHTHWSTPTPDLKMAVGKILWATELEARWAQFKAAAKAAGYKKLWVGKSPHSETLFYGNMIFAEPPIRIPYSNPLFKIAEILGGASCGNGLDTADQVQLYLVSSAFKAIAGEHVL